MNGAGAAHQAIASNIANASTPGYHRTDVSFKEALARTEVSTSDPDEFGLVTNDPRQMSLSAPTTPQPFSITTTVDDSQLMRADGSNVDMDQEMAKLSINSGYAQTMAQMVTNSFTQIKQAIMEQA